VSVIHRSILGADMMLLLVNISVRVIQRYIFRFFVHIYWQILAPAAAQDLLPPIAQLTTLAFWIYLRACLFRHQPTQLGNFPPDFPLAKVCQNNTNLSAQGLGQIRILSFKRWRSTQPCHQNNHFD
jgi:hypothetical protein